MADLKELIREIKTVSEPFRNEPYTEGCGHCRMHMCKFNEVVTPITVLALIAEIERLQEQWDTRFDTLCGNCGQRYRGPRDSDKHGIGKCDPTRYKGGGGGWAQLSKTVRFTARRHGVATY